MPTSLPPNPHLAPLPPSSVRADGEGRRSAVLRYGVALLATALSLALSLALYQWIQATIFIFFFAAVIIVAWFGGRGPALLATALAIPLANWFLQTPRNAWATDTTSLLRLAVFAVLAVLIGTMREALDRSRLRAVAAAAEAQRHAQAMEDQAIELEEQASELQQQAAELELQTEEAQALARDLEEAQRLLRESTARQLAEAQALAHVGSWEWVLGQDGVWWSDEMFRVYGYQPGEIEVTFAAFLDRVHPDDRATVQGTIEEAVRTRQPFEFEHRIILGDGRERILHARGRTELDEHGAPARMLGTGQDVTEAREAAETARTLAAERAARAQAESGRQVLEALLEGIGEAFVAFDPEWRYTYANARAEALIQKSRHEVLGQVVWEVFPEAVGRESWHALHQAQREGRTVPAEYYDPAIDRWLSIRAAPWAGGVSLLFDDVTDRRRAEAESVRLATIVESSEDAIFSKALDGTVQSWNAGAERLYGYTAAEIVGKNVSILAPADRKEEIPAILARLRAGERIPSYETVRMRKDGTLVDVLLTISPLPGGNGEVIGASTIARDITARKRTEAALRASEAGYRRLIETAEEGIWLLDTSGRTTYVNERLSAMLGRTAAEMQGRSFADFVHPESRAEAADHLARRRDGSPERHDFRLVRADGSDLWALVSLSAVLDGEGRWSGALAMVTDVTERRRAEDSLRFLADASRVLAESLQRETVVNALASLAVPRLADACGVVLAEERDGRGTLVAVSHADPAREADVRALLERRRSAPEPGGFLRTVMHTGRPVLLEDASPQALAERIRDPETLRLTLALQPRSILAVPLASEGRTVGAILLAVSESGRRYGAVDVELAEELGRRAATALENARLHQAEHDARRAAERAADQTARLQAVTAALSEARTPEEVANAALRLCMEPLGATAGWIAQLSADRTTVERVHSIGFDAAVVEAFGAVPLDRRIPLTDAVRTGEIICVESRDELERRYPTVADVGQRNRFGAWAVAPMWVEGRAVGGLVLNFPQPRAFNEETRSFLLAVGRQGALALERARLYEAERRARAEAEAANRAKFEFLTTMSHELRTPLNAIAGYVDLLDLEIRGPVTPEQRSDLGRIRRSQLHLLGLINDVLNFARIETGHVHFDLRALPVDEVLEEVEELIAPQVQARGLSYEYRAAGADAVALADPEKVRQIVLNLLSNAVKFTPGGGEVVLSSRAVDNRVHVLVSDNGIGIPADKLGTIFEPFVQVNAGYTRTTEGTGLGLSISRDLARAMGGDLTAESREGEGSTFTLILPRADGAD
ncbi:MAG TPA: PAS domain S-box protein [Longimicrobium sp.]|nr:PAS domain S-box protein [Longimicrobium sp.]